MIYAKNFDYESNDQLERTFSWNIIGLCAFQSLIYLSEILYIYKYTTIIKFCITGFFYPCRIIKKKDLCFTGKSKKIMENVTGCFRPERLTIIVGPSGAGKTTLLRIISTLKSSNVQGSITVNGVEWNGGAFRKQTCFLPQEFALSPLLTTRETLYIAARLKMRGNLDRRAFCLIVRWFKFLAFVSIGVT